MSSAAGGETVDSQVLVVGGGPVGVSAALMCASRGMTAVVLERATEVYNLPRAIVMDDEIQRALAVAGTGDRLRAITSMLPGAEFIDTTGKRIIGFELPDDAGSANGYAPVVRYYQPELEALLRAEARRTGVDLRLGAEVTEVGQDADGVWARLVDGTTLHANWLIAADGAASPIRKSLGIAFEDQGFDQDWLVVDSELTVDDDAGLPRLCQQICDPARPSTFVPGHGRYRRWEFQLQQGETREEMSSTERVWQLLSPWLQPHQARIVRAVVYRFHATVAQRFREGRIFLAGDAAHQTPPFLGQGLCAGMRDAANLAWKLQLVEEGRASVGLFDTYDTERRPHAAGLVAHAVDMGRLIDQLAGRGGEQDGLQSAYGGHRPFPHLEAGMVTGDHPLVGRQAGNPFVGGRRLDEHVGAGFAVVVPARDRFAGSALATWERLGATVAETDALTGVAGDAAVVIRPDRYVAAVCADAAALERDTAILMRDASFLH